MPSNAAPRNDGWDGVVRWIGPPPGPGMTSGFGRIWRWSSADSGASGLPVYIARAPGDGTAIESVLADPPGAREPGLCLDGPGDTLLALGRHPMRRRDPLRHEQWVLRPEGRGWSPHWLFSEAHNSGLLADTAGKPIGHWDKPGRVRPAIGRSDTLRIGSVVLRPGLVRGPRPRWGTRPVVGVDLSDERGELHARIAGEEPVGRDITRELQVWWRSAPSLAWAALTMCCLASVWDGQTDMTD